MNKKNFLFLSGLSGFFYTLGDLTIKVTNWNEGFTMLTEGDFEGIFLLMWLIFGIGLTLVSKLIYSVIIAKMPLGLSQASTISFVLIFTSILGIFILKETLNPRELWGIIFLSVGMIVMVFNQSKTIQNE